jgi:predicted DNA binding protein
MEKGGLLVRFRLTGDDCPLADATRAVDARVNAWPELCRDDEYLLVQCTATGDTEALADHLDSDDRIRYLYVERSGQEWTYRCLSSHACIQAKLFDIGFMPLSIRFLNGEERYQGAVVGQNNLREIFERAKEDVGVHLEGLEQIEETPSKRQTQQWDLTPPQEEALRTALQMDYFSIPRDATAQDVADAIGISQSAFLQRLHRAEKRIFTRMFETDGTAESTRPE